jgi:hypothetical protein
MAEVAQQQQPAAVVTTKRTMMLGRGGFDFDFESAQRFAKALIDGGMVPKGINSPGAVLGMMQAGKELGLPPMYALSNLTFTNGRLGIMGDAAKALIRNSGELKPGTDFEETYTGEEFTAGWKCTVTAHRNGQPKPFEASFSLADAQRAKLIQLKDGRVMTYKRDGGWGDHSAPWSTYTKRLMKYRALGFLVRDHFSDIIGGLVTAEELRDYPVDVSGVHVAPPAGPDSLLAAAPVFETAPPSDVIEAETVADDPEARSLEKFEGDIAAADSSETLDRVWNEGAELFGAVSIRQKKALAALYEQTARSFGGAA